MNRKQRLGWVVGVVLLLVAVLVGPRVSTRVTPDPINLPDDLDAYLTDQEAQFPDLRPDTRRQISWADPVTRARMPVALVYVHGFSATHRETAPLTERLAAQLGANVYQMRLTGHGLAGSALAAASVDDWADDLLEAQAIGSAIGDQVVLIGVSTGGSLVAWLLGSAERAPEVAAAVLISPNFGPANQTSRVLLWPWGRQIAHAIQGEERCWQPSNALHGTYWTTCYPTDALLPMMGTVKLARDVDPASVTTPLMVIYAPGDQVVDPTQTLAFFEALGAPHKRLLRVENAGDPSQHVLAGDILSPTTTEPLATEIVDFLAPLLTGDAVDG